VLAVPGQSFICAKVATAMRDGLPERVDVVKAVRCADRRPLRVVEGGYLSAGYVLPDESPVEIEVKSGTRGLRRCIGRRWSRRKRGLARSEEDWKSGCRNCGCAKKFAAGYGTW